MGFNFFFIFPRFFRKVLISRHFQLVFPSFFALWAQNEVFGHNPGGQGSPIPARMQTTQVGTPWPHFAQLPNYPLFPPFLSKKKDFMPIF